MLQSNNNCFVREGWIDEGLIAWTGETGIPKQRVKREERWRHVAPECRYTLASRYQQELLTQAPDPLPTQKTHAFTQWQQHPRFLTDQLLVCVCTGMCYVEKRGKCVPVCLSVKGMHS